MIEKYTNGAMVEVGYDRYETSTDTITTLPTELIADTVSAYTIKGNMAQNGECGVRTENLFDISEVRGRDFTVIGTTISKGSSLYNTDLFSGVGGAGEPLPTNSLILEAGTYTLAYDLVLGNTSLFMIVVCPYSSATREPVDKYFDGYNGKSFTISEKNYVSLRIQQSTPSEVKDVAIYNTATAPSSYEPYGFKIPILSGNTTTNIYIGNAPLRKSIDGSDVYDTIESNGTLTRRVDENGDALATPTVTQITTPVIPTLGTAEQFDIDTSLKPSELSLAYTGWHNKTDTKF